MSKYEVIPQDARTDTQIAPLEARAWAVPMCYSLLPSVLAPCLRMMNKLKDKSQSMENLWGKINAVYGTGAVEGYTEECLALIRTQGEPFG